jgi:hypothetical protein
MTFFYDLNKRLQQALETPKSEHKQLNERDMSRAAKGYEKYGKEGMEALAKAGREGKSLDPIRAKYDKYDNTEVDEGLGDMARKVGGAVKKVAGKALDKVGHGSDADMIRDLQKKIGMPQTGMKPGAEPNPKQIKEKMSPAKAKSFAALAEPKDKITFADKIAGAKKEVDEMLGDVAANAMKSAITSKGGTVTKTAKGVKHSAGPGVYGGSDQDSHPVDRMKGPGKKRLTGKSSMEEASDDDNNPFTNWKKPRAEKPKVGSVERGHKHDIEHTATGRKVTRRTDDQGYSVGADDDTEGKPVAKGRGRPKGTGGKIGAKGPSGKSKLMTKEGASEDDIQILVRLRDEAFEDGNKMLGNKIEDILQMMDDGEEQVSEKAVSKKQQRFMGMVHATQKGEKAPSKEVAKVAKSMGKKDAEDFAATKHKGLPEKKKPEGKKKEKTEEAGGSGTPTASSGFSYGKGIYDSMNRDLEDMISESMSRLDSTLNESMSVNMSNSTEGGKSLTITATDDDAMKLASILKMAGLGGGDEGYGGSGYKSACGDEELDEVSMNEPDYPTNTETSDNAMQYSGGLDGPKSTGQSTVPVLASQDDRQGTYAEAEEDALHRMMEMAGIEFTEEMLEEGWKEKLGAAGLAGAMALGSLGAGAAQAAPQQGLGTPTAATQQQTQDIWMPAYQRALSLSSATKDPMFKSDFQRLEQFYKDQSGRIGLSGKLSKNMEPKAAQDQKQLDLKFKDGLEKLMQRYGVNEEQVMAEEDDLARMMEMAGVKKKEVEEEKTDEGNKFTGNLAKARADGKKEADLDGDGDMEKVRESIFDLTNQWRAYKG